MKSNLFLTELNEVMLQRNNCDIWFSSVLTK